MQFTYGIYIAKFQQNSINRRVDIAIFVYLYVRLDLRDYLRISQRLILLELQVLMG